MGPEGWISDQARVQCAAVCKTSLLTFFLRKMVRRMMDAIRRRIVLFGVRTIESSQSLQEPFFSRKWMMKRTNTMPRTIELFGKWNLHSSPILKFCRRSRLSLGGGICRGWPMITRRSFNVQVLIQTGVQAVSCRPKRPTDLWGLQPMLIPRLDKANASL